jgi:hypothetical protein
MRQHSALDIQSMPLNGVLRFLFRLYTDTEQSTEDQSAGRYTITMSNVLRMVRDANLYGKGFHWSDISTLFQHDVNGTKTNNTKLDWLNFNQTLNR